MSGACGAVDADAYSYCKKKKFASVGGDYCDIFVVCAGFRDCSGTVNICCNIFLLDFGGGCGGCCEVAEEEDSSLKGERVGTPSL